MAPTATETPISQPNGATQSNPTPSALPLDLSNVQFPQLDRNQIMQLLTQIPGVFSKPPGEGAITEDAAKTLSNLSQQAAFVNASNAAAQHAAAAAVAGALPHGIPQSAPFPPMPEPGPSSHPRGPPNLGHLAGMQAPQQSKDEEEGDTGDASPEPTATPAPSTGGRRGTRGGAAMGSEEWSRQRKDNHKEVERRRRGNINEGINELGRIVPNGSGEKSKGAILSRAVQYIHHLKENEARNIEKWTLEKLLMDQAMGDLQAQLEDMRRGWEEERVQRQRAESELEVLRGAKSGTKRANEDENEDEAKRQRTE
ncbi:hypothetical protein EV361DRAFT_918207 [Lentinula raphanica]|uniref:BHLH domain-containing protein n=1 Tax=Lentinula raphanica TaxID=153919 RepID=A0AA38P4Z5_9AGAR|nr:hypothetical protein F5878DRAFT_625342 [Lentinula raphanica]KAJ3969987.1 hypothetical protein EV361DRAFT_918207 [Lentinula raphanica]